jgi:hypothetical protein
MDIKPNNQTTLGVKYATSAALFVCLYFMYSSTFLTDYLMNDELGSVGSQTLSFANLIDTMGWAFLYMGRGLFGAYRVLVYSFAGFDPARIQLIRFVNFASIAIIAVLLLRFLEHRHKTGYLAFFAMLFWLSQPPFQVLMGYSLQLIANSQPAMWFSLLAFYLFFFVLEQRQYPMWVQAGLTLIILLIAMQSTQTYAFFAAIPVTYLALTEWQTRKRKIAIFIALSFAALFISMFVYQLGLSYLSLKGTSGYALGEQSMSALTASPLQVLISIFNPLSYWSLFKIWTFPFPFQHTPNLSAEFDQLLAMSLMICWLMLIAGAIIVESRGTPREERRNIYLKWLAAVLCFGLNAVFVISDSPLEIIEHRPHIYLTLSGIVIFTGIYSLRILSAKYAMLNAKPLAYAAAVIVLLLAFGAQSDVLRNMVNNNMRMIDFIRTELSASPAPYDHVIVILPAESECPTEPCGPWRGRIASGAAQIIKTGAYKYALATIGISPQNKKFTFTADPPNPIPENTIIVDWRKFTAAREHFADRLYQK